MSRLRNQGFVVENRRFPHKRHDPSPDKLKRRGVQLFSQITGSLNADDVIALAPDHEDRAKDLMDFFQRVMIKTSLSLREKPVEGLSFPNQLSRGRNRRYFLR